VSFSSNGVTKTTTTSYSDGSSSSASLTGSIDSVQWANDHITKTTIYRFTDGTTNPFVETIGPTLTAPVLTGVIYPSDWSSGTSTGTVTKPVTSPKQDVFGDGFKYIYEDGTVTKPFQQSTLTPIGAIASGAINDPNAYVTAPTKGTYDLRWGEPDPAGPTYAGFYANGSYTFDSHYSWFGHTLNAYCGLSQCANNLQISKPSNEVLSAFNMGWTGKGTNVLIWDSFSASQNTNPSGEDYHGATTSLLAWRYAPGATYYALDAFYGTSAIFSNAKIIDTAGMAITNYSSNANPTNTARQNAAFYVDVVNMSFGWEYQSNNKSLPTQQSDATTFINNNTNAVSKFTKVLTGVTPSSAFGNTLASGSVGLSFKDAVLTVSAGNEAIRSDWLPLPYLMAHDSDLGMRTLIVGALNGSGTVGSNGGPGTGVIYAPYTYTDPTTHITKTQGSNTAGYDLTVQGRFLVANGLSPFPAVTIGGKDYQGISIDGTPTASYWGTSYAAPRVAGYAAVVRQKFPNLTGANTADILLATARYDTLACYPNCDKAIYGQGEASLSRALAPVGYLR